MEKKKIKTIGIAVCAIAVLGMGYWTYTNISELVSTRKEWAQKSRELLRTKKEVADIERLLSFYKKEKTEFQKYLFAEKDIPAFLDGLSNFAQNSGINIIDMKTSQFQEVKVPESMKDSQSEAVQRRLDRGDDKPTKDELDRMLTLAAMPITFKIQGPYTSIVEFQRHLENFKQLLNVSNIEIASTVDKYPALECAFTLKIYSLKTLHELQNNRQ